MLVIISDLHLTDGTSGETINAGAFEILRERLSEMAYDASKRDDGVYKPIDGIDLLLLGDALDAIRSTRWLDKAVRPWDDFKDPEFVAQVRNITRHILDKNEESFKILRSMSNPAAEIKATVSIPKATADDRPYQNARANPAVAGESRFEFTTWWATMTGFTICPARNMMTSGVQ